MEKIPEDEAEDMAQTMISPDPGLIPQDEIDEDEFDDVPFRQRCEECTRGRGAGEQHRICEGPQPVAIIAFD